VKDAANDFALKELSKGRRWSRISHVEWQFARNGFEANDQPAKQYEVPIKVPGNIGKTGA
jgi:hypothetical protein